MSSVREKTTEPGILQFLDHRNFDCCDCSRRGCIKIYFTKAFEHLFQYVQAMQQFDRDPHKGIIHGQPGVE